MWLTSPANEAEFTSNCVAIVSETTWHVEGREREQRLAVAEPTVLGEDRFWNEVGNVEVKPKGNEKWILHGMGMRSSRLIGINHYCAY